MANTRQRILGVTDGPRIFSDNEIAALVAREVEQYDRSLYVADISGYLDAIKHFREAITMNANTTPQDVADLQWLGEEINLYLPIYEKAVASLGSHWTSPTLGYSSGRPNS